MIQFAITAGPDLNALASYSFHSNQVYLGKSSGDLWIKDPSLLPSHLLLEIVNGDLLLHPQKGVEFFLLNGKRATSIRKLKLNDQITIGMTQLSITAFEETLIVSKKNILDQKLEKLIAENSSKLKVIEAITKKMS